MPLSPDNLARRGQYLTATDMAAVLGVHPYKTGLDVYADKTIGPEPVENDAVEIGTLLEDDVLELASRRLGATIIANDDLVVCDLYPWLAATPDGYLIDEATGQPCAVVEAKWSDSRSLWENGAPEHYRVQVQVQMMCAGLSRGYIAALVSGRGFALHEVLPDEGIRSAIIHEGQRMREAIAAGVPPEADYTHPRAIDAVRRVVGHTPKLERTLDDRAAEAARRFLFAKRSEEAAAAERKAAQAEVEALMGDAGIGLARGYRVVKSQRSRITHEVPPEVAERYPARTSTYFVLTIKEVEDEQ